MELVYQICIVSLINACNPYRPVSDYKYWQPSVCFFRFEHDEQDFFIQSAKCSCQT